VVFWACRLPANCRLETIVVTHEDAAVRASRIESREYGIETAGDGPAEAFGAPA